MKINCTSGLRGDLIEYRETYRGETFHEGTFREGVAIVKREGGYEPRPYSTHILESVDDVIRAAHGNYDLTLDEARADFAIRVGGRI